MSLILKANLNYKKGLKFHEQQQKIMNILTIAKLINKLAFRQIYKFSDSSNSINSVKFTFIKRDGTRRDVVAHQGQHILQVAKLNDVQLEGACQASLACSTCHVILPKDIYDKLQSPKDEEDDLLDLAFGLTPTSRLGCQVKITSLLEGCQVVLPKASRNLYVDGTKPSSH